MSHFLKNFILLLSSWILIIINPSVVSAETFNLVYPAPRSPFDISHDYYSSLLKKALTRQDAQQRPPNVSVSLPMQQGRAIRELEKGMLINVFWVGTDKQKEARLRAVKIPLERGLMGFRRFIVRRDKAALFRQVTDLEQLKKFTACQGTHWPDSPILEQAGLHVLKSPVYENLFEQLNAKRCDYFPRGFHEGLAEIEQRKHRLPDLTLHQALILYYPFTVYFFVQKQDEKLALAIEAGLRAMIKDGSFYRHIRSHPLFKDVFPLSQWQNQRVIEINNRDIPPAEIELNKDIWLVPAVEGSATFATN